MPANTPVVRKLWTLLTPSERRELIVLLFGMVIAMALETLSAALVLPVLSMMTEGGAASAVPGIHAIVQRFSGGGSAPLAAMLVLVVVYLVKNTFLATLIWRQSHFAHSLNVNLSQRIFALFLAQPYTFHLERNAGHLLSGIYEDAGLVAEEGVGQGLAVCAEVFVLAALGALVLYVEPLGALLVAAVVGGSAWAFHALSHRRIDQWGAERQFHSDRAHQHLLQGLGAAKEVIVLGRQQEFLEQYHWHNARRGSASQRFYTLKQLPRLALESSTIVALAILMWVLLADGQPAYAVLPTIGLFAAAAVRALPSANRILGGMQSFRYALPSVSRLYTEFTELAPLNAADGASSPSVLRDRMELHRVSYTYPTSPQPALLDVSMHVALGESVGIIGSSGAGKSTLVDVLLGLLEPSSGSVRVDDQDIRTALRAWQNQVGYVPQVVYLTDDTVRRNIAFGLPDERIDEHALRRAIRGAQLETFVLALPEGLDTRVGERGVRISGGERQRIGIARALYHDPAILILDEATSSLDAATERGVMATVNDLKRKKTVVIVSHRATTIEQCDRVYELSDGRVRLVRD